MLVSLEYVVRVPSVTLPVTRYFMVPSVFSPNRNSAPVPLTSPVMFTSPPPVEVIDAVVSTLTFPNSIVKLASMYPLTVVVEAVLVSRSRNQM